MSFTKALREGGLDKLGLKLVADDIFTPPLADASPLVQKLRSARPDFMLLVPTATSDYKLILEKMNEFGLGKGKLPLISNGAPLGTPEILKLLGKDLLEGLIFSIANWPVKGQEKLVDSFQEGNRRALDDAGQHLHLRRHVDLQGSARGRWQGRPQGGRRSHPQDGDQGRLGPVLPGRRRRHEVRRQMAAASAPRSSSCSGRAASRSRCSRKPPR